MGEVWQFECAGPPAGSGDDEFWELVRAARDAAEHGLKEHCDVLYVFAGRPQSRGGRESR